MGWYVYYSDVLPNDLSDEKWLEFPFLHPPHTHTPTHHTHTHLLVKRVNWGYLYTPIQTGTFECGYTPAYWGYTKYECDYTPITWGYPNIPSIGDMLLNAFIWHFRSHAGNAQMGTSPVGSVSTFPLAESDVCPRFTRFTNAHTHTYPPPPHTHTQTPSLSPSSLIHRGPGPLVSCPQPSLFVNDAS